MLAFPAFFALKTSFSDILRCISNKNEDIFILVFAEV